MAELGWLDDGARLGMLDAQRFRAARVVIDVGVHWAACRWTSWCRRFAAARRPLSEPRPIGVDSFH